MWRKRNSVASLFRVVTGVHKLRTIDEIERESSRSTGDFNRVLADVALHPQPLSPEGRAEQSQGNFTSINSITVVCFCLGMLTTDLTSPPGASSLDQFCVSTAPP